MKCFAFKKGESCYPGESPNKCCFYCEKKYLCKGVCIDLENDLDNNAIVKNCKDYKESSTEYDKINKEENPMILLSRYEVLYAKNNWVDEDVKKVMQNGRSIIVVLDGGEKGIAKCHPADKFDMVRGYNIAYARAKIKLSKLKIEYFKKQLNSERAGLSGYESYLELISKDKSYE